MSLCFLASQASIVAAQPDAPKPDAFTDASPLLHEPETPDEKFAAVLLMVDLARLDLAGRYLQQFSETSPDDELLIKLRDKYGTGEFMKLSRIKALSAQATQRCLAEAGGRSSVCRGLDTKAGQRSGAA
jgi:hypothetical protein